mmetsp:Transcript_115591/g.299701  ORF Transcript_115591/g.299701 Transcript_115591/m.299701 type:complete len:306 (+) Transcript_115591:265-1182(+)
MTQQPQGGTVGVVIAGTQKLLHSRLHNRRGIHVRHPGAATTGGTRGARQRRRQRAKGAEGIDGRGLSVLWEAENVAAVAARARGGCAIFAIIGLACITCTATPPALPGRCRARHEGSQRLGEVLLRKRQATPGRSAGTLLGAILGGHKNHRLEPRVLHAPGLALQVLDRIGCQALRHCGRHLQNLLRDIPCQLLPSKDIPEEQCQTRAAQVEEAVAFVLLRGEVGRQVEKVKRTFKSLLDHVVQKLLWSVTIWDVPQHDGCGRRRPVIPCAFVCAWLRVDCEVALHCNGCRQPWRRSHGTCLLER